MKKPSLIHKALFVLNVLFIVGLFFSFILPYLPPKKFGLISLLSLIVPVLIFGSILFLLYWILIRHKKRLYLNAFILILSFFFIPSLYKLNGSSETTENELSIMSYNVRKFNKYGWIKGENIGSKIGAFVTEESPDVLAMQEYKKDKNLKLKYPYEYIHRSYNWNKALSYPSGLAFFSKYPIIDTGAVKYKKVFTSIAYIDILKNYDTIRIYNCHLESLGVIPSKDYFGHKDSEKLLKRLNSSFKIQQTEIDTLNHHIKNSKYRTIIAGDMNNTAYSWAYKNLKKDRQDSFLEAGKGFGRTYSLKGLPLRIDYIFVDEDISVDGHENYDVKYSDHFPVMATVSF